MRLSILAIMAAAFGVAAILSLVAASFAVTVIEENTEISVRQTLDERGFGWAEVQSDGLRLLLSGTAPTEALRFQAISATGAVIDAARVIDEMEVQATAALTAPRFSVEILRNESGVSIIGLVPAATDRAAMVAELEDIADGESITDLLETADYPAPRGWDDALGFSMTTLARLPRSKVSVDAGRVIVTAIADSAAEKQVLETELQRSAPPGLRLSLNIAAPRPVITPFTLRFISDDNGARFDACSAQDQAARNRILAAARTAGASERENCVIGMGVPSPNWDEAAEMAIAAVQELGGGAVTFANADVTLVALQGTNQSVFDRVVGELETRLPEVFALHAVLPEPETGPDAGPAEFVATLSPEGLVQLRGRVSDANLREVANSFAQASFGSDSVYVAARVAQDLPADWPVRVLAGLEALSMLVSGAVTVTAEEVAVQGITEQQDAKARMSGFLSEKLGEAERYTIDVVYREPPPPADQPMDPDQCERTLADILSRGKITFEPGSATIAAGAAGKLDEIAETLQRCGSLRLEIQGHTDSQGREVMNQELSQARAQAVLTELRGRRVPTGSFVAKGYGEARPIQDNSTEAGREANRRIEFRLIRPTPTAPEVESTLDSVAQDLDTEAQAEEAAPADGEEGANE
ncbi:OmpA family protein [Thalassococcus sp. S3]|uniref:OmpA family protein n=1 Tax=Thalassococcus sp. S3 TaxID=2017482 RepID=UPI00102404BF|nr:OmpA family protein [Thalassococcus sp. S3]QBF33566.1 hypothetical protein CFI11_20460 [Thalassococcus sp. S3]